MSLSQSEYALKPGRSETHPNSSQDNMNVLSSSLPACSALGIRTSIMNAMEDSAACVSPDVLPLRQQLHKEEVVSYNFHFIEGVLFDATPESNQQYSLKDSCDVEPEVVAIPCFIKIPPSPALPMCLSPTLMALVVTRLCCYPFTD